MITLNEQRAHPKHDGVGNANERRAQTMWKQIVSERYPAAASERRLLAKVATLMV